MPEDRGLRLLATVYCVPYKCEAKVYIQDTHPSGYRHLIAQYGDGCPHRDDLPTAENGRPEFTAGIPSRVTDEEIFNVWLFWPMTSAAPYPKWEIPARLYGSKFLFRWWAGEKPELE